jgi:hypothetical protein
MGSNPESGKIGNVHSLLEAQRRKHNIQSRAPSGVFVGKEKVPFAEEIVTLSEEDAISFAYEILSETVVDVRTRSDEDMLPSINRDALLRSSVFEILKLLNIEYVARRDGHSHFESEYLRAIAERFIQLHEHGINE